MSQFTVIYLKSQIPHASKSENMKARTSFMVSNYYYLLIGCWDGIRLAGEYSGQIKIVSRTDY